MSIWKSLVEGAFYLYAPEPRTVSYNKFAMETYECESVTYVGTEGNKFLFRRRDKSILSLPNTLYIFESVQPKYLRYNP